MYSSSFLIFLFHCIPSQNILVFYVQFSPKSQIHLCWLLKPNVFKSSLCLVALTALNCTAHMARPVGGAVTLTLPGYIYNNGWLSYFIGPPNSLVEIWSKYSLGQSKWDSRWGDMQIDVQMRFQKIFFSKILLNRHFSNLHWVFSYIFVTVINY